MLRTLIIFFISYFLLLQNIAYSVTVEPDRFSFEFEEGQTFSKTMRIRNDDNFKTEINFYFMDIVFEGKNRKTIIPRKNSISKYISISPSKFILNPKEIKEINLIGNPEPNFKGGNQTMLFIESTPYIENRILAKKLTKLVTRMGIPIYSEVKGTTIVSTRIKDIKIINSKNSIDFDIEVLNKGDANIDGKAFVSIMDSDYKFISKLETKKKYIPPFQSANLRAEFKSKLKSGLYHALITFVYRDKSVSIDKVFNID